MVVMLNKATKDTFSCLKILFSGLKIREKRVYGNDRKIQPWTWKSVLGSSILDYFATADLLINGHSYQ